MNEVSSSRSFSDVHYNLSSDTQRALQSKEPPKNVIYTLTSDNKIKAATWTISRLWSKFLILVHLREQLELQLESEPNRWTFKVIPSESSSRKTPSKLHISTIYGCWKIVEVPQSFSDQTQGRSNSATTSNEHPRISTPSQPKQENESNTSIDDSSESASLKSDSSASQPSPSLVITISPITTSASKTPSEHENLGTIAQEVPSEQQTSEFTSTSTPDSSPIHQEPQQPTVQQEDPAAAAKARIAREITELRAQLESIEVTIKYGAPPIDKLDSLQRQADELALEIALKESVLANPEIRATTASATAASVVTPVLSSLNTSTTNLKIQLLRDREKELKQILSKRENDKAFLELALPTLEKFAPISEEDRANFTNAEKRLASLKKSISQTKDMQRLLASLLTNLQTPKSLEAADNANLDRLVNIGRKTCFVNSAMQLIRAASLKLDWVKPYLPENGTYQGMKDHYNFLRVLGLLQNDIGTTGDSAELLQAIFGQQIPIYLSNLSLATSFSAEALLAGSSTLGVPPNSQTQCFLQRIDSDKPNTIDFTGEVPLKEVEGARFRAKAVILHDGKHYTSLVNKKEALWTYYDDDKQPKVMKPNQLDNQIKVRAILWQLVEPEQKDS